MALNLKPAMLAEKVFEYLQSTTMKMMPWERYAVLSFDSCILTPKNSKVIKCIANDSKDIDEYNVLHCIIVQLSYLHNKVSFPIAVIYCNESFINPRTVAYIITGIMHDLLMLSLRITATVCPPNDPFIQVVAHLCSLTKDQICVADKLTYTVGAVGTFGRIVVHVFDFELVLSQIKDVFTKVNIEFDDNGGRSIAKFQEVFEFINYQPEEVRHQYIPSSPNQIPQMRKLFNIETTSQMRLHIEKGLSSLSSYTERICDFFAQTLITMQKPINAGNKAAMRKTFYKTLAVLNSMVLIKPGNNILHDKYIDNISKIPGLIIENKAYVNVDPNVFEVPITIESNHTCYAKVAPVLIDAIKEKYFRYFGFNMAMQAVNGISAIYTSLERHNFPILKLKRISLISQRETVASIQKAFEAGGLKYLKSTSKFEPAVINVVCEAFYNGFKLPENH